MTSETAVVMDTGSEAHSDPRFKHDDKQNSKFISRGLFWAALPANMKKSKRSADWSSYPERVRRAEVELLPDVFGRSGTQSVEDVIVSLLWTLPADPRLLQQVVRHEAAHHGILTSHKTKTGKTHFNIQHSAHFTSYQGCEENRDINDR